MKLKVLGAVLLGTTLGFGVGAETGNHSTTAGMIGLFDFGISKAEAKGRGGGRGRGSAGRNNRRGNVGGPSKSEVRGTARRTARRTTRRTSIAGCAVWRVSYWNCGGVYYRAVIEDGVTVYVVFNP